MSGSPHNFDDGQGDFSTRDLAAEDEVFPGLEADPFAAEIAADRQLRLESQDPEYNPTEEEAATSTSPLRRPTRHPAGRGAGHRHNGVYSLLVRDPRKEKERAAPTAKTPQKQTTSKRPRKEPEEDTSAFLALTFVPEDQCPLEYQYGKDFLPDWRLKQLPWQVNRFHEWYKTACELGVRQIVARVPDDAFMSGELLLYISFKDLCAMFRAEKLDIQLMAVWCLLQAQDAVKTNQNICYLHPQRTYAGRYKVEIDTTSEEYRKKSKKENKAITQKLIKDAKLEMSVYIARAMRRFAAEEKNCVMAVHHIA
ncbi:hypothetical protein ACP70R_008863 [Stipagrostis hirtigluma subsp. patula]